MKRLANLAFACLCVGTAIAAIGMPIVLRSSDHPGALFAELLLIFVLGAEGLLAVAHLRQAEQESRASALREIMKDLSTDEMQHAREVVYEIPWGPPGSDRLAPNAASTPVIWQRSGDHYTVAGQPDVALTIKMTDEKWRAIRRIAEAYHAAGLLLDREHLSKQDFLDWVGVAPHRCWGRLATLIQQERQRRSSDRMWYGFEEVAKAVAERLPASTPASNDGDPAS